MSLTILYRDPQRPFAAGMTMIAGQARAAATVDQLEKRGFVVDKITFAPLSRTTQLKRQSAGRLLDRVCHRVRV